MATKRNRTKIHRELPPVGTILNGKFKGVAYKSRIVSDKTTPAGREVKHEDRVYPSMTAAANVMTKQPTNGWRF